MKKEIDVFEHAGKILKSLEKGILLTSKADGKVNTMSIAWGSLAIEWNKKIFIAYVREGRFTREYLDKNPEFTVNISLNDDNKRVIGFCGTKSGRDHDKIKEMGLSLVEGDVVSVPAIKEFPLTLECKVLYSKLQDKGNIPESIRNACYPKNKDSSFPGGNKDYHIAYYGEIVSAYIIED